MNYLNITKYIYLVLGFVMLYDAFTKWNNPEKPWLSIAFAVVAFFLFFFRNKFAKKFENRNKNNNLQ